MLDLDLNGTELASMDVAEDREQQDFYELLQKNPKFMKEVKSKIAKHISTFFAGKGMHCGGHIPLSLLKSEKYVSLVLYTTLIEGLSRAYESLESFDELQESPGDPLFARDVCLVLRILNDAAERRIPKIFAGGLLLMELELCEGIEID